ncbi:hypothetical protein FACS1894170_10530 [Planctomycetales bacterium]|nr:hypothetical protein FACS1894170_10530 [Planctomycetales bacterium]
MQTMRQQLCSLIDDFINCRIYIEQFCSIFDNTYHHEMHECDDLSVYEKNLFGELARMAHGYTEDENEIKMLPQYYFTAVQIVNKVKEVNKNLRLLEYTEKT